MKQEQSQYIALKKRIAFFDFDGTITTKDSLLEFIKFTRGTPAFYLGFLWNSPYLVAYKLKIISNQKAKEKILRFYFKNMPLDEFQTMCNNFFEKVLLHLIRPKAIEEINKLKESGASVIIISASPENWIIPWTTQMGVELMATTLQVLDGKITGNILGNNCHGKEKTRRIAETFNLTEYDEIYAYGDSKGDEPMLALASHSFMKPFR